ncbi:hypothetical protein SISSUDRAFT_1036816, partial [Sistotremastrum suecicum HHB10207 ss-3]
MKKDVNADFSQYEDDDISFCRRKHCPGGQVEIAVNEALALGYDSRRDKKSGTWRFLCPECLEHYRSKRSRAKRDGDSSSDSETEDEDAGEEVTSSQLRAASNASKRGRGYFPVAGAPLRPSAKALGIHFSRTFAAGTGIDKQRRGIAIRTGTSLPARGMPPPDRIPTHKAKRPAAAGSAPPSVPDKITVSLGLIYRKEGVQKTGIIGSFGALECSRTITRAELKQSMLEELRELWDRRYPGFDVDESDFTLVKFPSPVNLEKLPRFALPIQTLLEDLRTPNTITLSQKLALMVKDDVMTAAETYMVDVACGKPAKKGRRERGTPEVISVEDDDVEDNDEGGGLSTETSVSRGKKRSRDDGKDNAGDWTNAFPDPSEEIPLPRQTTQPAKNKGKAPATQQSDSRNSQTRARPEPGRREGSHTSARPRSALAPPRSSLASKISPSSAFSAARPIPGASASSRAPTPSQLNKSSHVSRPGPSWSKAHPKDSRHPPAAKAPRIDLTHDVSPSSATQLSALTWLQGDEDSSDPGAPESTPSISGSHVRRHLQPSTLKVDNLPGPRDFDKAIKHGAQANVKDLWSQRVYNARVYQLVPGTLPDIVERKGQPEHEGFTRTELSALGVLEVD